MQLLIIPSVNEYDEFLKALERCNRIITEKIILVHHLLNLLHHRIQKTFIEVKRGLVHDRADFGVKNHRADQEAILLSFEVFYCTNRVLRFAAYHLF